MLRSTMISNDTQTNGLSGFLRLKEVLKIIPVGRSTWLAGVKSGKYPQPYKLSERCTAWKAEDVYKLIEEITNE